MPAAPVAATRRRADRASRRRSRAPAPARPDDRAQAVEAEQRVPVRLRRCREHGAGDQVVDAPAAATASAAACTERPMRKPGGASRARRAGGIESPRRCTPSAPQASATSRRSLTTMRVARAASGARARRHQRGERRAVEIALADLNQVDAAPRLPPARACVAPASRAAAAVGDQADHHGSSCRSCALGALARRKDQREIGEARRTG